MCGDCGRSFAERPRLIRHQRTHKGKRPFVCDDCGSCFTRHHHLVGHDRTHDVDVQSDAESDDFLVTPAADAGSDAQSVQSDVSKATHDGHPIDTTGDASGEPCANTRIGALEDNLGLGAQRAVAVRPDDDVTGANSRCSELEKCAGLAIERTVHLGTSVGAHADKVDEMDTRIVKRIALEEQDPVPDLQLMESLRAVRKRIADLENDHRTTTVVPAAKRCTVEASADTPKPKRATVSRPAMLVTDVCQQDPKFARLAVLPELEGVHVQDMLSFEERDFVQFIVEPKHRLKAALLYRCCSP